MKRTIVVVMLSVVLTSCSVSEHMPDRAELWIDEEHKTYASPPCVIYGTIERDLVENPTDAKDPGKKLILKSYAEVTTVGDLRARRKTEKGWHPDENQLLSDWLLSLGKRGPEHRQTASRLRFGRFILQNIPVFRELAVGHSDDIGGDPISGPSSSRKPAMDYHVIVFSNDQAWLVLQRRLCAPI